MNTTPNTDLKREFLRHTLATLAYRCRKTVIDAPAGFGDFKLSETSRTPHEILAHIGDLLDWSMGLVRGVHVWKETKLETWDAEVARFFEGLRTLDESLASTDELGFPAERIFQGPIADALTHTGQIAYLRRAFGAPVRGENYFKADITAGRVHPEQAAPKFEFD